MKFSISHEMNYVYDSAVRLSTQYLRLFPRDTSRQRVLDWRIETPAEAMRTTDGYGNVLHVLTLDKPFSEIWLHAGGTVETSPIVDDPSDFTGTPLPPLLFLRPTALTHADEELGEFAERFRERVGSIAGVRELGSAVLARRPEGSSEDLTHAFIACCRHVGVPARYVSGYVHAAAAPARQVSLRAWAEVWILGRWRSVDIANDRPIGESHIKVAVGADYMDACPIRGVRTGGGTETLIAQASIVVSQ